VKGFRKRDLVIALHTAGQWHGDTGIGNRALLSLSSTRKVHTDDHRENLIGQIRKDIAWTLGDNVRHREDYDDWRKDIDRLLDLLHIVTTCEVGVPWVSDRENARINEDLYKKGLL
jgi:hypothetical protein